MHTPYYGDAGKHTSTSAGGDAERRHTAGAAVNAGGGSLALSSTTNATHERMYKFVLPIGVKRQKSARNACRIPWTKVDRRQQRASRGCVHLSVVVAIGAQRQQQDGRARDARGDDGQSNGIA